MTAQATTAHATGIASIGLHFPSLAMPVEELAQLRGEDPDKYKIGLGCDEMAICPPGVTVVDLATEAARRALDRWGGPRERIGMIAVGTETAVDMSRPLSAWVADRLGLSGAIRSYEVKHACYGGTLAVRQAAEWRMSGAANGNAALVVAADVALYEEGDPGEPTQGAGGVAMVIDEPRVAAIDPVSYPWSEPQFDFWRPVGESYPRVDGPLSLDCYKRAAENCFRAMIGQRDPEEALRELAAICFHVPFPKMVRKAFFRVGEFFDLNADRIDAFFQEKIYPTMLWNRLCGNAYTASLWISVAQALKGLAAGQRVAAFSYGSGFGAELMMLEAGPEAAAGAWGRDVDGDLAGRARIDGAGYRRLRGTPAAG
ncbi:MAG: hydroxymethylglutaryl-CoA synthase [Thermoanaerobaculia bacterium]|nr:hydroxymethylglutaryl-CoA synthase [Thermoanaerobaculia bacterium]